MTIYIRDRLVSLLPMFPLPPEFCDPVLFPENAAGASNPEAAVQKGGLPAWVSPSDPGQKTEGQRNISETPDVQHNNCTLPW